MEATPLLSAIILNYQSPQRTVRCARNLLKQTIADQMEIFIVDNHSADDSIGVLRNQLGNEPRIRILETPENRGFGGGNNYGARYAQGKYLLILNPDTEPAPACLEYLIAKLREDPGIGIIAPKLVFPNGTIRDSYRSFPNIADIVIKRTVLQRIFSERMDQYLHRDALILSARNVDWVVGACMLMRRSLFEKLEGFDERFFLFFEDTDLCRRCWACGKRVVYEPSAAATDAEQRLSGGGLKNILTTRVGRVHVFSAVKYFWKWI